MIPVAPAAVEAPADQLPAPALPDRASDPRDLRRGDVDVRVGLSFSGTNPSPATVLTALGGWNTLSLTGTAAVWAEEDVTVAVGASAFLSAPLLFSATSGLLGEVLPSAARLDWFATELGATGRLSLHYNGLETVAPYLLLLAGPSRITLHAKVPDDGLTGPLTATAATAAANVGLGVGVDTGWHDTWVGGVELHYLASARARPLATVPLLDADGVQRGTLTPVHTQRGTRGFAWRFTVGRRF